MTLLRSNWNYARKDKLRPDKTSRRQGNFVREEVSIYCQSGLL